MTAGSELISSGNDVVVSKNVGGLGNDNVGLDRKDDADESSYVFVSDSVEVIAGDPGGSSNDDVGSPKSDGGELVEKEEIGVENGAVSVDLLVLETNGDVIEPKSDTVGSVVAVKEAEKEELGMENGARSVDVLGVESNGGVNGSEMVENEEVKNDVIVENGSTVDEVKGVRDDVIVKNGSAVEEVNNGSADEEVNGVRDNVIVENGSAVEEVNGVKDDAVVENGSAVEEVNGVKDDAVVENGSAVEEVNNGSAVEEVNGVKDDVIVENGSTVEKVNDAKDDLIVQNGSIVESNDSAEIVNGHIGEITEEEAVVVKSVDLVEVPNGITDVEVKTGDIVSEAVIESLEGTVAELESTLKLSEEPKVESVSTPDVVNTTDELLSTPDPVESTDGEVMVTGAVEPTSNLIDEVESQVAVDKSVKQSEDSEAQVIADGLESTESPLKEGEVEVTVDESGKPSEDSESQVTADVPESCGSPVEEQESNVSVDGTGSVDYRESLLSVDGSEHSGNHTEEVDSRTVVMESDGKSEVNVEAEPNHIDDGVKAEHQSESISAPNPSADNKAEGEEIGSVEVEEYQYSGVVLSKDGADVQANGHAEKLDGILEMGETQISQTEADKEVEESSETLVRTVEPVETEVNSEELKEQVKTGFGIQESREVVLDTVQNILNVEDTTAELANEAEVTLEVEANIEPVTDENTTSQSEVRNRIEKPQEGIQSEDSSEMAEVLSSIDPVKSEFKNDELLVEQDNDSPSNPDESTVVEQKVESIDHMGTENRSAEDTYCESGIEKVDVPDDDEKETEIADATVEHTALEVTESISAEGMNSGTGIENADVPDTEDKEAKVKDAPVGDHPSLSFPDTYVSPGAVIEFGSIGRHETIPNIHTDDVMDVTQSDGIPTSSVEGSASDTVNIQEEEVEVLAYNFLVKFHRYEEEGYREQLRNSHLLVDEKTRIRDAIRLQIQDKRALLKSYNEKYHAAKSEESAVRKLVRLKREEIGSVQGVIDKVKNALSVEDIDARIANTERIIQHETLQLKDEKQFIREIKQLRTLRDQLASNLGTREEMRLAIDQKEENEERLRTLRKELDSLKVQASKAEAAVKAVGQKYDEEARRERELQAQFRIADDVRQKAYVNLHSVKRLSYDKNKDFNQFRKDLVSARTHLSCGDTDALHRLCANQVETFMDKWTTDVEFRNEYINCCNLNASRRVQRVPDGGSFVPGDVAPVQPSNTNEKVVKSLVSIPVESKSVLVGSAVEQLKIDLLPEVKHAENNSNYSEKVLVQKNQTLIAKCVDKPTLGSDDVALVATKDELVEKKEEVNTVSTEEIELARKAEELKKEEEAKQKEQRRMEEKAKATEALERKKRNAEKAQIRAELRARKEAEQKEKEREKRLRKKEKKKAGGGDRSINGEEIASSEISNDATTKETETVIKENTKKKTQKPPPHFFSKQLKPKPIPPPLNKNKKRWQQVWNILLAALAVIVLFLIGNGGYMLSVPKYNSAI